MTRVHPERLIFSHPTGNANVRQALLAFAEAQMPVDFHTTIGLHEGGLMWKLASQIGIGDLKRRAYVRQPLQMLHLRPLREVIRMIGKKLGINFVTAHELGPACVDKVYQDLDRSVARSLVRQRPKAVYAYEDGALQSFKAAKVLGIPCYYDLPIGYWRAGKKIQSEEAELRPEWASTMPALIDSEEKLHRKDLELQMSDRIVVATSFTRRTLDQAPFKVPPVTVIPYGSPCQHRSLLQSPKKRSAGSPLRLLFVGSLGQRKGLADLLDAMVPLESSVTLTLIGQRPRVSCQPLDQALEKHRWIRSLPHSGILREMAEHDVLVFPSLFEGFGLVILEAMSQGLPVITTANTAGPDIITDGRDGYIVPIRSSEAIRDRLELLRSDPVLLAAMSEEARKTALKCTWEAYRTQLVQWVLLGLNA